MPRGGGPGGRGGMGGPGPMGGPGGMGGMGRGPMAPPPGPGWGRPYRRGCCSGCLCTFLLGGGSLIVLIALLCSAIF